jgi:arylsulfatase A-like enzyme
MDVGYHSVLIGEQHVSKDPRVIGFDRIVDVDSNHTSSVAPAANAVLGELPEPFFLSVGFFETHRDFQAPTSVRDSLYSMPPPNLPDTRATREDMAAFKASARSLDQGVGSVMNELYRLGLADRTLIICTTDHGLAVPRAKATLFDRGTGVMLLMRGPGGFTGGKVVDSMVSHLDVYPTLCEIAGAEVPPWVQGTSLLPLVSGEVEAVRDEVFTEMTFHAAYEPMRAIRTDRWKYIRRFHDYVHPVLANCDDSATKDLMVETGWGQHLVPEEQLYDLIHDPNEHRDLSWDPRHKGTLSALRGRVEAWMEATDDPLRLGPIEPPPGAVVNAQTAISPAEEPRGIDPIEQTGAARGAVR